MRREIAQVLDNGTLSEGEGVAGALDVEVKLKLVETTVAFKPFREQINKEEYSRFLKAMAYSYGRVG